MLLVLSHGVMVAQQVLVLFVKVRILVRQLVMEKEEQYNALPFFVILLWYLVSFFIQ